MTNSNKWTIAVVVIVVVALIAWAVYRSSHNNSAAPAQQTTQTTPAPATPAPATGGSVMHGGLTYTQAIAKYPNRIQFNNCHAAVGLSANGIFSIKKGAFFMLDNRDKVTDVIAFANQTFRLGGEDFAIVSINTIGTYNLTCDGGGSATIKVG